MVLNIYLKNICLKDICNVITEKFNNEIIFYDEFNKNNDMKNSFYIEYNNLNLEDNHCLNIIDYDNEYLENVLNLNKYFYILECDLNNIKNDYSKLIYISYVIYNFILINTKIPTNKPIVLDPITTIFFIRHYNNLIRYGDGEILLMQDIFINYASKINKFIEVDKIKTTLIENINNKKILNCIPDSFYDEYYTNVFYIKHKNSINNGLYHSRDKYLNFISNNNIYGSCFIGRIYGYKSINIYNYLKTFIDLIIKNNNILIICNKNSLNYLSEIVYEKSKMKKIIICPELQYDDDIEFNINNFIEIIKNNCNDSLQYIFFHFGIYTKYIINKLIIKNIKCIDMGLFDFKNIIFTKNFYYDIKNVLYRFNYYIFDNNTIKYQINHDMTILDENESLNIIINKIVCTNNKLDFNMEIFGIRFNQESISKNYTNSIIKGKLKLNSNMPLKIFNGKKWLHINMNTYDDNFEIYNIDKWRISPSNEFLNSNLEKENIEFIIYDVQFKINEIID